MPKKSSKKLTKPSPIQVERAVVDPKSQVSQQPRFDPVNAQDFFMSTIKWVKEDFESTPMYSSDSRARSKWLARFWPNEPYLAGVINSVVQIDRNRGWSLVGGRNQVMRFTDVLHNWQVQPGRASWRDGSGTAALSFYTTDIGGLVEVGRAFKDGPMVGMYHLDPTRCTLRGNVETPLRYYPKTGKMVDFTPSDYMRMTSAINIEEDFNGLGYCALSRCIELAILMVAVYRHEGEQLFARAPRGLLLLKGISQASWNNAMKVRDATLNSHDPQQQFYGAVSVLCSTGMDDVDAKLIALSQLPADFDQKIFTDLLMYGYALCFGYDPREFWPVSSGALGTATETDAQKRKATSKGEKEFGLALTEELQSNLPDTLHFEIDERSVDGEMSEALLQEKQVAVIKAMGLSPEQEMMLLAEKGIVPHEWSVAGADVESTDTEDADSPDNSNADVPADGAPAPEPAAQMRERMMEYSEVQRAAQMFPAEPLVAYSWPSGKIRSLAPKNGRTVHPVARIMQRLANDIKQEPKP